MKEPTSVFLASNNAVALYFVRTEIAPGIIYGMHFRALNDISDETTNKRHILDK